MSTVSGATVFAEKALLADGWAENVAVSIGPDGRIASVERDAQPIGERVGILLPAPVNLHSHAFQRAMAGMSERRGSESRDSFWTWRQIMFRFLDALTPEDVEAIATFVQMEMLEAGYAAVGEFHYLHHQPDGSRYEDPAELSARIVEAAAETGIGLTLLPVLYERGGCDGRPLGGGQRRFGNDPDGFAQLFDAAGKAVGALPADAVLGVAPHSLRAVSPEGLGFAAALAPSTPIHLHIAEQTAEVEEVAAAMGARPVAWLMANAEVDGRWCLIHATHMTPAETEGMAESGAVAGLCPITESSLGDGIFDGVRFLGAGGAFGVGSDSNIRIALAEELRVLEYSQRLRDRSRAALAETGRSTGRVLFEGAALGGTQAVGRDAGAIAPGRLADLLALDPRSEDLDGMAGDGLLDAWIFARADAAVRDVWAAGRHVVAEGRHRGRDAISERYRRTIDTLRAAI